MPGPDLRTRALKLLARREHSRVELVSKLAPHAREDDHLDALLDEFEARGWLSDARFAEALAHDRKGRYGSRRIARELSLRGVSEDIVERAVATVQQNEAMAAREVWRRKFGSIPRDRAEHARQARFLAGRGFSWDAIEAVLRPETD
jgi:regulatory protein